MAFFSLIFCFIEFLNIKVSICYMNLMISCIKDICARNSLFFELNEKNKCQKFHNSLGLDDNNINSIKQRTLLRYYGTPNSDQA